MNAIPLFQSIRVNVYKVRRLKCCERNKTITISVLKVEQQDKQSLNCLLYKIS